MRCMKVHGKETWSGGLSTLVTWQLLQLYDVNGQINLDPQQPDQHIWLPLPPGEFSLKSACERFFVGGIEFEPHKAKLFLWLAIRNRCWTADRLQHRGMPHPKICPLYDQCNETINHLLLGCVFAREIWYHVLQWTGMDRLAPHRDESSF